MKYSVKHIVLLILFAFGIITVQAQGTIDKLRYEEAESAYMSGDYTTTLYNLKQLKEKGLKAPNISHLYIKSFYALWYEKSKSVAGGYKNLPDNFAEIDEFHKEVDYFISNYDIEGLEDKYKEIYEIYKLNGQGSSFLGLFPKSEAMFYRAKGNYCIAAGNDRNKALEYYLKAVKASNASTSVYYDGLYYTGYSYFLAGEYEKAREYLLIAANKEFKAFQVLVGHTYDMQKNYKEALHWYKRAVDNNQANLGVIKHYPIWAPDNFEKEYAKLHYRHNNGFGTSVFKGKFRFMSSKHEIMFTIGVYYLYGREGVEKNESQAFEWFMKAADDAIPLVVYEKEIEQLKGVYEQLGKTLPPRSTGYPQAQIQIGDMYYFGQGIEKDPTKAVEWYKKAANQASDRNTVEKDLKETAYENNKIIENPNAQDTEKGKAIRKMALILHKKELYNEAIKWLLRDDYTLGLGENDKALETTRKFIDLAGIYEKLGEWEKAFNYFERVFNSLDSTQQSDYYYTKMGLFYYEGKGVEQSYKKAYEYWSWNTNIDVNKIGYGSLLMKAVLLYSTKEQKDWGNDHVALSVDLVKQLIKKTEGSMLKYANQYYTNTHINERFPQFAKDKEHFFAYLAKEYNIIFE